LPPEERYPCYTDNEHCNEARIVAIDYIYCKYFRFENINMDDIQSIIIKPNKFVIPDNPNPLHNITNEIAKPTLDVNIRNQYREWLYTF